MTAAKTMWFDGCCPFLLCLKTEGHTHPICPDCEAVNYGNMFCNTCMTSGKEYRDGELEEYKATVEKSECA